jgi:hypothetical protein
MHVPSLPSPGEVPKQTKQKQPRKPKQPKEPVEKRTNEYGATVRYAAQPSQAVYQRIQRALPGKEYVWGRGFSASTVLARVLVPSISGLFLSF